MHPRYLYLICCLICHCFLASAQQCSPTFQEILFIDGQCTGNSVLYTPQDEVLVAGNLSRDAFILKTAANGQVQWARSFSNADTSRLKKIIITADGNYLAFGTIAHQLWLVKTDPSGQPIWHKTIQIGTDPLNAKDITALSSGGYAIIANSNDSTDNADGIAARLDATGTPTWIRKFDGKGEDGFNYIHEVNGQLLISGFITGDLKDAFLMKLDPATGQTIKTTSYSRNSGWDEEGINISTIDNGYSWGIKLTLTPVPGTYSSDALEIFKSDLNDNNFLTQYIPVGFGAIYPMKNLQVKPTAIKDGFIFINNYPDNFQFPTIGKVEEQGHKEWSRNYFPGNGGADWNSIDYTAGYGYVITGRARFGGNNIYLVKTDLAGIAGSCANGTDGGDGGSNDMLSGNPFTWAAVNTGTANTYTPAMTVTDVNVTVYPGCSSQTCVTPPPADNGDNCATSMLTTVKDGYSITITDAVRTSDGDIMTIGNRSYYWTNRPQIAKLKGGGNMRWAKQIDSKATEDGYNVLTRIIRTTDNNLVITGYSQVTKDHSAYDSVLLMKVDNAGNILWSKRMTDVSFDSDNSFTAPTPDGGFIIASNSGYGIDVNKVMKFDAAGNVVWQQQLQHKRWNKTIQGMQYDNGNIYLCLDMPDYNLTRLEVVKLNATDGSYTWSRYYSTTASSHAVVGMECIQDSLYIGLVLSQTQSQAAVLKLDTQTGDQKGGFYLSGLQLNSNIPFSIPSVSTTNFTKTLDNNLLFTHEATVNGTAGIFVSKFKTDGTYNWQRHFTQLNKHGVYSVKQDGAGCIITGTQFKKNTVNEPANEGFLMRLTSEGEIENPTGACVSQPVTIIPSSGTTTPFTMVPGEFTVTSVSPAAMNIINKPFTTLTSPSLAYPSCANFSVCLNLAADGPEKICDLQQTYNYHATRDASCTATLTWKTDPAFAQIISQAGNDVTIKFLKTGNTTITALLDGGCQVITAIKNVEIVKPVAALDLGADFELCQGRSFTLDAGSGYTTYEWNDGSTDQQLIIRTPGTYTVKVTDACNNDNTTAIIVTDGGNHPFSLGPDLLKCAETSVTINLPTGFQNLTWNTAYNKTDLPTQAILFPALDTTYILSGTRGLGCTFADTLKVSIYTPVSMSLPADTALCPGQSVQLAINSAFTDLSWTNGLSGYVVHVTTPGRYIASALDVNTCISRDTFQLLPTLPPPVVALPRDTLLCEGTVKQLDAGNGGNSYLWNTGETSPAITVNTTGQWWVQVTGSNNCITRDTSRINTIKPPPHDFLVADTLMCLRGEIYIHAPASFQVYRWSNGNSSSVLHTEKPGLYTLEITDKDGCEGRDSVFIGTKDCGWGVYVPSAFSPNHDGKNDYLRPVVLGRVNKYRFTVFDRWGNMVFQTNQADQGWDGMYKSMPANVGAYVWVCEYELNGDQPQVIKGVSTLIK